MSPKSGRVCGAARVGSVPSRSCATSYPSPLGHHSADGRHPFLTAPTTLCGGKLQFGGFAWRSPVVFFSTGVTQTPRVRQGAEALRQEVTTGGSDICWQLN